MIVYFADRYFNILGQASTELPDGLKIVDDRCVGDIESGVAVFEFTVPFSEKTRALAETCGSVGNYLLRSHKGKNDFYTIIDSEVDTKRQKVTVYAEDAGLELLNEIVGEYAAEQAYPIDHYINKFAYDSGFEIGVNEATGLMRKLSWEGDATATERIASVATQFGGYEISYSFEIDGLSVTKKLINIHKQRGNDVGVQLRLNRELDRIITKKSIANLATALLPIGGTPEGAEYPIDLSGYKYDDGDIYVEGRYMKSRSALAKWTRYLNPSEPLTTYTGHILKKYSSEALTQAALCSAAVAHLKKISEIEVNYEVEMNRLPDGVQLGDRVNIVDDAGALYMSARILELEESVANRKQTATLGEYLIKSGGISQKVADLAAKFAEQAQANAKAAADAVAAKEAAEKAEQAATEAQNAVVDAEASAQEAQEKAAEATAKAAQALADAAAANAAISVVQSAAETTAEKAEAAQGDAAQARADAEAAAITANAAKVDAAKAQEDIAALGENLETVSSTMQAEYARKTDLTEATASLQTQISQNAGQISSTATKVQEINETANGAAEVAKAAQSKADAAKTKADQAATDAENAATAAASAATAAGNAQSKADAATTAADAAKSAADKADADLVAAQKNLESVTTRVGVTEAEIAEAQAAVETAQAAADKAKTDSAAARSTAATAKANAEAAQTAANTAKTAANNAQAAANAAQDAADAAQADVDALAVRVATAETNISQTADDIALMAKKTEVEETLGGYYNKTETDAKFRVEADKISSVVNTVDGLGPRLSAVEQTASGLSVQVDDAAKTATNFLSYDAANGLQIGNKTSGSWSGCRAQIKPDSYNIVDANGKEMSTFGTDKIELGKNDTNAVISLCGGAATIKQGIHEVHGYEQTEIIADCTGSHGYVAAGISFSPMSKNMELSVQEVPYRYDGSLNTMAALNSSIRICIDDGIYIHGIGSVNLYGNSICIESWDGTSIDGDLSVNGNLTVTGSMSLDKIYPVNSIYISYSHTSPASLFGGSWTRISGRFLFGTAASGTIGNTGGETNHTLTANEMPNHMHDGIYYKSNNTAFNVSSGSTAYKFQWTAKGTGLSGTELRTGYSGGGAEHNNMPPFINVSIWRRKE